MKAIFQSFFVSMVFFVTACKQPKMPEATQTPLNPNGNVTINFKNQINNNPIEQGAIIYTNASGNLFSVDLLKYYVTNVILVKDDGSEFPLHNYDLIDAFDLSYSNVMALKVPNGHYTSMKFSIGVDAARNHSGAQDGDLDPAHNMIWAWSTGYIFFKHEGSFKNTSNTNQTLQFHLGTDEAYALQQIPIELTVAGTDKTMNIVFDLNKMYNSPMIDFNIDNFHMSSEASDKSWIANMVANMNDAFVFKNVQ